MITRAEFREGARALPLAAGGVRLAGAAAAAAASDELLDAVFSLLDTDGSGALDYKELHLAFRK